MKLMSTASSKFYVELLSTLPESSSSFLTRLFVNMMLVAARHQI